MFYRNGEKVSGSFEKGIRKGLGSKYSANGLLTKQYPAIIKGKCLLNFDEFNKQLSLFDMFICLIDRLFLSIIKDNFCCNFYIVGTDCQIEIKDIGNIIEDIKVVYARGGLLVKL